MVQINELRIGNRILGQASRNFDRYQFRILDTQDLAEIETKPEKYEPIPLTVELLGDYGFVFDGGRWERKYNREFDTAFCTFWIIQDNKPAFFYGITSADGFSAVAINNVSFLHDLQNIFYDLSKTEL